MSRPFFAARESGLTDKQEFWRLRLERDPAGLLDRHLIFAEEHTTSLRPHAPVFEATTIVLSREEALWVRNQIDRWLDQMRKEEP